MQHIAVFGATSAIASAFCRLAAARGAVMHLVGRDATALQSLAADLEQRGAERVSTAPADLCETERHSRLVAEVWQALRHPDLVLLAHGSLGSQARCQQDWTTQRDMLNINLISHLSLLTRLAERFEDQRSGCLAAIGSVAGDRGRASNYVYGAAKAGLSCYLGGLQQRLAPAAVRVVDLRLGRVDTPMTSEFDKGLLWSTPERIARSMHRVLRHRSGTVYLPGYWRPLMALIRALPNALVRRLGI